MKTNEKTQNLIINILSAFLMMLAIMMFLLLILYFQVHSPEYLTHEQFYMATAGIAFAYFAGLLSVWIKVSDKLTDFAQVIGRLEGSITQFIQNHQIQTKSIQPRVIVSPRMSQIQKQTQNVKKRKSK